jgi:hypothetical protein
MNNQVYIIYEKNIFENVIEPSILPDKPNLNPSGMNFDLPFPFPIISNTKFNIIAVCGNLKKANEYIFLNPNNYKLAGPFFIEN